MSRVFKKLLFLAGAAAASVFLPIAGWGALSKTFPTSPVTIIRLSAYQDVINTIYNSTYTVSYSTHDWDTSSNYLINQIVDDGIEQYMVFPSTTCPSDWKGWKQKEVNGKLIPDACP